MTTITIPRSAPRVLLLAVLAFAGLAACVRMPLSVHRPGSADPVLSRSAVDTAGKKEPGQPTPGRDRAGATR